MLNGGGKDMEEDCYFMIFVQSRLNCLNEEKNWTNWDEISSFVKFWRRMKKDYYFMIII